MTTVQKEKAQLRKKLVQKRAEFSKKEYTQKNELIRKHVSECREIKNAKIVHCFISMNDRFEVDTFGIITELLQKDKNIVVPVMNGDDLNHSILHSLDNLEKKSWGVYEPAVIINADTSKIDVILVPLLAVDESGNRLGYGKGYYDRFLNESKSIKLGLVFEEFILDEVPTEKHDVKLDGIISEKGVRLL